MTGPPTYDIKTVRDFLAVPEDRIDACLHDFGTFLRTAPHWATLIGYVCDEMHGEGAAAFSVADRFRWIDDAKHDMTMTMLTPDGGEIETLTITPEDAEVMGRNLDSLAAKEIAHVIVQLDLDRSATDADSTSVVPAVDPFSVLS